MSQAEQTIEEKIERLELAAKAALEAENNLRDVSHELLKSLNVNVNYSNCWTVREEARTKLRTALYNKTIAKVWNP